MEVVLSMTASNPGLLAAQYRYGAAIEPPRLYLLNSSQVAYTAIKLRRYRPIAPIHGILAMRGPRALACSLAAPLSPSEPNLRYSAYVPRLPPRCRRGILIWITLQVFVTKILFLAQILANPEDFTDCKAIHEVYLSR